MLARLAIDPTHYSPFDRTDLSPFDRTTTVQSPKPLYTLKGLLRKWRRGLAWALVFGSGSEEKGGEEDAEVQML